MQCASSTAKSAIRRAAELREEALVVEALRRHVEQPQRARARAASLISRVLVRRRGSSRAGPRRRRAAAGSRSGPSSARSAARRPPSRRRAAAPAAGSRALLPPPVGKTASADRAGEQRLHDPLLTGPEGGEAEPCRKHCEWGFDRSGVVAHETQGYSVSTSAP